MSAPTLYPIFPVRSESDFASKASLGTIKVEITRVKVRSVAIPRIFQSSAGIKSTASPAPASVDTSDEAPVATAYGGALEICEKSLKGGSVTHGTTYVFPFTQP